ncbi:CW-type zinc finger [Actinidia rufa]|uniref:CW-type zinc finger n=1 Tax=Actinidia rufa TaxID=165716 RepID=A0A7J0E516_9ERIC|nr:CW-type zinc finger [Actinidia rufa]
MITVGFKEGSKGLGLGFGCEGEAREGEIWNPDITFSNLDDRLEKALGAFRKDFKGGIPSGNLGPIYGDYGSFLPVYHWLQGGRVREGFSDWMKTKKRSLRLTDRDFNSVCKKSKVDDVDCLSAKDQHKYDIHPSKGRNRNITLSNINERLEKILDEEAKLEFNRSRFYRVCKKSKVDDMDPLSVSASAKDWHKYDIHLSKGRKCEASKSSKSSVSGSQNGTVTHSLPSVHGSQNQNGKNRLLADDFMGANSLKTLKQNMNLSEKQNANQSIAAATDALKEAVKLKDYADRIHKSGSISEGMSLSFEAALKYLHAASSLESCHGQSEMILQSMQMYRRAAELCESCAHEYEKSKDMAAAALSYKCMEVAYMRIISSSHAGARKRPARVAERLKKSFLLVNILPRDVNSALEASTKSRIAFVAASRKVEDAQFREGTTFVKKALDFSFQDVEGLLWLVRQALEAIIG